MLDRPAEVELMKATTLRTGYVRRRGRRSSSSHFHSQSRKASNASHANSPTSSIVTIFFESYERDSAPFPKTRLTVGATDEP